MIDPEDAVAEVERMMHAAAQGQDRLARFAERRLAVRQLRVEYEHPADAMLAITRLIAGLRDEPLTSNTRETLRAIWQLAWNTGEWTREYRPVDTHRGGWGVR